MWKELARISSNNENKNVKHLKLIYFFVLEKYILVNNAALKTNKQTRTTDYIYTCILMFANYTK